MDNSMLHKVRVAVWGESAPTAEERKLVRKLDFFILTYSCLQFFFNYLDRAALSYAYTAGLQKAAHLSALDFNTLGTMLTVGYIVGQIPHAIAIQKIAPRIWLPLMAVIWAGLTMCLAACKTFSSLAGVRFLQGLVEASTYSGVNYIIGSWYKPQEIGKRTGMFAASGMLGQMFAGKYRGYMMDAMISTMEGKAGLAGWQWNFILDGIITIPIAIFGFLFFPDTPETTKAPYFSAAEKQLALERLPKKTANQKKMQHDIGISLFRRVLISWDFWAFTLFWVIGGALEAISNQSLMLLWMKNVKYSTSHFLTYPTVVLAIGAFSTLLCSVLIDASGLHTPWGLIICALQIISCGLLLPHLSDSSRLAGFWLAGTSYAIQPVVFSWANKIMSRRGDDAARAITLYAMNGASSVLFAFWGIVLYPATTVPWFKKGIITSIIISILTAIWIGLVGWLDRVTPAAPDAEFEVTEEEIDMDKKDIPTTEVYAAV